MLKAAHLLARANLVPLALGGRASIPFADQSFHCCVTSPPYFALRDYGVDGQLGLESTPEAYIANQVAVFREVRRVLRDDGTLWLNIGDSFSSDMDRRISGLKPKDLILIPARLALALQADGWYVRSDIIWHKVNCMPESVRDRPSRSHEYVFLLTKSPRYYYDEVAERKPQATLGRRHEGKSGYRAGHPSKGGIASRALNPLGGAVRSVWPLSSRGYKGAHFAIMPPELAARCIRLGSSSMGCCPACGSPWRQVIERDRQPTRPGRDTKVAGFDHAVIGNRDPARHVTSVRVVGWESTCTCCEPVPVPCRVFDPYGGAGTTPKVATQLGRHGFATELSSDYLAIASERMRAVDPDPKTRKPTRQAPPKQAPPKQAAKIGPVEPIRPPDLPSQSYLFP